MCLTDDFTTKETQWRSLNPAPELSRDYDRKWLLFLFQFYLFTTEWVDKNRHKS